MGAKASKFRKSGARERKVVQDENEEPEELEVIRNYSGLIDMAAMDKLSPEEGRSSGNFIDLRVATSDMDLTDGTTSTEPKVESRDSEPEIIEHISLSESYTEKSKLSLKTKFSQQKLDGWEPIVTPKTIWKQLCVLGILITAMGVCMLVFDILHTSEIIIPYSSSTECEMVRKDIFQLNLRAADCKEKCTHVSDRICSTEFTVPFDMHTPVYIYYEITNFHQNHRLYTKSKDDHQLFGRLYDFQDQPVIPYGCSPAELIDRTGKVYYPCGAIAGSMFSDVFTLENKTGSKIPIDETHISFTDFKKLKYAQPLGLDDPMDYVNYKNGEFIKQFTWPKHWSEERWKEWFESGGVKNPAFVNWMQPYHSSTIRKLYGSISGTVEGCQKDRVLCRGSYKFAIKYRFDVDSTKPKSKKNIILATTSFFGTRNIPRAIAIISFGLIILICSVLFFVKQSFLTGKLSNCLVSKRLKQNRVQDTETDSTE
ncbi:putative ALA-interacting subunit 4 [Orchesella cincta]|uniref:Putative ALA-interacting subunit 4 n=1 Tax=Orchesella cincta TaxID=48709 RepID=A0A1D2N5C7_ORCCI|nr:putative ALA-interacting subunit 4 [Orchesella cincta]